MISNKKTIKSKLFTCFFILLAIFAVSILVFQDHREKQFRIALMENQLNEYSDLTNRYIENNNLLSTNDFGKLDSIKDLIPSAKIRITVLDLAGRVLYDNSVENYSEMENHLDRPEVQKAKYADRGYNIRHSVTTKQDYFYFAKFYKTIFIRSAVEYNAEVINYLKVERAFIIYLLFLFAIFGLILRLVANRLGDSVSRLKEFTIKASRDEELNPEIQFPEDELGTISREISLAYERSRKVKAELMLEKEKLISHLFVLKEGVAFFSPQKQVILTNSHFIFYSNIISEESSVKADKILEMEAFSEISSFIDKTLNSSTGHSAELPRQEFTIQRNGMHFQIQVIFFQDRSFEILITDNTQLVKRSIMKQQLTSNIAHELKTPIASVKGYLETVLNNPDIDHVKLRYFVEKAHNQSERLTQLVNDIALLNKIEESSDLYPKEKVKVAKLISEVIVSFSDKLKNKSVKFEIGMDENVTVNVNYSLLFSVFRNLTENSVDYGGDDITIQITNYHEDNNFHYFSFSDNGQGVEEEHLPRIFERFYRVDSGRSRKEGGTGLGLAIVKNAILSFKGEISVRNKKGGGLEFLFSIPK
ncbi:MAG: ATP-binding protein [Bacteroidota bacterium]|jgi:signal transduction histidine kinase|nr:ATP-binding protein [Bacteroidota bacterium]HQE53280.1 ATP-binding protein [Prolixibacteraceae bacterium]HQH77248.1 ATP-binding protein [Prolixibacteraceae bacterium]